MTAAITPGNRLTIIKEEYYLWNRKIQLLLYLPGVIPLYFLKVRIK